MAHRNRSTNKFLLYIGSSSPRGTLKPKRKKFINWYMRHTLNARHLCINYLHDNELVNWVIVCSREDVVKVVGTPREWETMCTCRDEWSRFGDRHENTFRSPFFAVFMMLHLNTRIFFVENLMHQTKIKKCDLILIKWPS